MSTKSIQKAYSSETFQQKTNKLNVLDVVSMVTDHSMINAQPKARLATNVVVAIISVANAVLKNALVILALKRHQKAKPKQKLNAKPTST